MILMIQSERGRLTTCADEPWATFSISRLSRPCTQGNQSRSVFADAEQLTAGIVRIQVRTRPADACGRVATGRVQWDALSPLPRPILSIFASSQSLRWKTQTTWGS